MKHGVPQEITALKLKILKNMSFVLRTAFGIAKTSFGNIGSTAVNDTHRRARIFGVGQGMQDSGALWIGMWAVLYSVLATIRPGAKFVSADGQTTSERKGEAIIDDLDLWITENTLADGSIAGVTQGATELYQKWTNTARLGGAQLNQNKGRWYLFHWIWEKGVARLATIDESPAQLQVTDNGILTTIERVEPSIGTRMVGVRIDPETNENDEFKFRHSATKLFTSKFKNAPFSRLEAKMAHEMVLMAQLKYPLAITTFDDARCKKLQAISERTMLNKCGFKKTFSLPIRYGPKKFGGLEIQHLRDIQGSSKVRQLLESLRAGDEAGTDMLIHLSILQLEAGICEPVLTTDSTIPSKYITPSWLSYAWGYLTRHNLQIHVPGAWTPKPQRVNDKALMSLAGSFFGKGKQQAKLERIQRCRLYLRVTMLSEICDASGKTICPNIVQATRHTDRETMNTYPNAPVSPPASHWTTWKQFLKRLVQSPTNAIKEELLGPYQMGKWYPSRMEKWNNMYSPSEHRLYMQSGASIHSFPRTTRHSGHFNRIQPRNETSLPTDGVPISVAPNANLSTKGFKQTLPSDPPCQTIS
jgi:hypothetical protein